LQKIYLAATFDSLNVMREHAKELRGLGLTITSRWHDEQSITGATNLTNKDGSTDLSKELFAFGCAIRDIRDILAADTLVLFSMGTALIRNTRLAEFGGALFSGRQCIVIGPEDPTLRSNIDTVFVFLKDLPPDLRQEGIKPIQHYNTWDEFIGTLVARGEYIDRDSTFGVLG
jgi:hypothetical protein